MENVSNKISSYATCKIFYIVLDRGNMESDKGTIKGSHSLFSNFTKLLYLPFWVENNVSKFLHSTIHCHVGCSIVEFKVGRSSNCDSSYNCLSFHFFVGKVDKVSDIQCYKCIKSSNK